MNAFGPEVIAELSAILTPDTPERRIAALRDEPDDLAADLAAFGPGNDLGQLARAAHTLSGSAAVFGARVSSEVLRVLEAACRSGDADGVADRLEACRIAMAEARSAIAAPAMPCEIRRGLRLDRLTFRSAIRTELQRGASCTSRSAVDRHRRERLPQDPPATPTATGSERPHFRMAAGAASGASPCSTWIALAPAMGLVGPRPALPQEVAASTRTERWTASRASPD